MQCPECERLRSEAAVAITADEAAPVDPARAAPPDTAEGAHRCAACRGLDEDSAAALLRLLTQLANCGLTAEAPPILLPLSRT